MDTLTQDALTAVDAIINKHRSTPGPSIPMLQALQETFGYVAPEFLQRIAVKTGIPASDLYSIVTFYSQFRLEPLGRHHIQVCHGTACHLAGAERVTEALEYVTGTKCGCTSEDGEFTIDKVACVGCCSLAPVVSADGEVHGRLTSDDIAAMVNELRQQGSDKTP